MSAGGIGIRSAVQLAPSAFLASAAGSSALIHQILPDDFSGLPYAAADVALSLGSQSHNSPAPQGVAECQQKAWDAPSVQETYQAKLASSTDPRSRARLLAAATKESGAWLNALPISAVGLRMDDEVVRVAVGLRLGAALCQPHTCQKYGAQVDSTGTHGLSCSRSEGRHPRHAALNDVIRRSLAAAHIPSTLEPTSLCRADGKRPDRLTIVPWKCGCSLVWDVTCPDTFALSHIPQATREAGAVTSAAEVRKRSKYQDLLATHRLKCTRGLNSDCHNRC